MNTPVQSFAWGTDPLNPCEWHILHQLWLMATPGKTEFSLGYCYGIPNSRTRWLEFSNLREVRFPFAMELEAIQRLATRPVVARPNQPVHLPPGQKTTLYVGTSLWLCLKRGDTTLLDIPVGRLSDTWFGPNTRRGELCFACQTHARLSMDGVAANPWKAITPVTVRNESPDALMLDRINLPVPNLALYRGKDRYWTSGIKITQRGPGSLGEIEVKRGAPSECEAPEELASARQPAGT
ncbi:MAG: hypothetical protein HUJ31_04865, partial [Pseudomonadales bacterium]|nr:hypothetical protein [Pseudomonadales bacterium]